VPATRTDEIVDRIYRISTFSSESGITFNQFLVDDEQGMLLGRPVAISTPVQV
jgi:hypothetical protein